MKIKFAIVFITILSLSCICYGQDYSNLQDIVLKDKSDYPQAENKVLECAKYIISTPVDDNNLNRLYAVQFLIRWMVGTPEYTFNMDEIVNKITKSNQNLLGIYLACMTNFVLENKEKAKDDKEVKYNSILTFLNYCETNGSNVKINREVKKMIRAREEGKLKEYLKL